MYKFYLALKFFFSRWINLIAVIGIAGGVWLLTVVPSVMSGFVQEQQSLIRGTLSDIIVTPLANRDREGKPIFASYQSYAKILADIPHIKAFAPRINWIALIQTRNSEILLSSPNLKGLNVVHIIGVDPSLESKVTQFAEYLRQEPLLGGKPVADPSDPFRLPLKQIERLYGEAHANAARYQDTVILAESVFRMLGLSQGERIRLMSWTPKEGNAGIDLEDERNRRKMADYFYIAGSMRTGEYEYEFGKAYMSLNAARKFLELEREFTQIAVRLDNYAYAQQTKDEIDKRLMEAGLMSSVSTWEDEKQNLLNAVRNEQGILIFLLSFIIIVAGINIFVILTMMVAHKTKDVGIIATLGGSRQGIMLTFLGVGFLSAFFGEIIGGLAGYYTVKYLTPFELFLRDHLGITIFDPKIYVFDHLPATFSWSWFILLLGVTLFACLLASLIPAYRAACLKPVEALRYE